MSDAKVLKNRISRKAASFTESVIREMTREAVKYGAVNLGQGFPDFAAPEDIKQKAMEAIAADYNQYAITWGVKSFRDAIAKKTMWFLGLDLDPETEITVTCGSTEGMIAAMMATVDPGEEVVVFEPFYENYAPDAILSGAIPRHVSLYRTDNGFIFDREELKAAFNHKTKAIIICNPNNPTGKVFTHDELVFIADLCKEHDTLCFTDEIYEHIIYGIDENDPQSHHCMANIDGMRERTVVVNSLSKTYSVTGWRVGYCIAPPDITSAIRKVHDFLTVGAANPLQHAGAYALGLPPSYYQGLQTEYLRKRDFIVPVLKDVGFKCDLPDGAYYVMADISNFGFANDIEFTKHLIREIGVAVVPGSSFYHEASMGAQMVRFCFCKKDETLEAAAERLIKLRKG
ncbi:MAG TPA: aminotransferase class I/II-fold pyridoxal phosphate-dependent enzyme [Pyrinomonadaceae bacterium]|jgi:aminotransferase|nr:aminotransferase class I/II-fold pyridoxal phosphate-dependent enzyme [Chloracidobacterium sp.]MBP9935025.1 aminotransferase class I/II-fold pyridoxal phosphate-dependent enzyme [Pyrinomonadaceae bacterium]MBK7801348.1 aminotransferase class I/II-fold pyridoxal phosphate-dependent enzyme [Chloracidobacterium sp.]MBK9436669.1 aminotransferase class I/II-fold pyridoxal phosphate-dependent enzyme [Chloracidobacterium sp.]MBK9766288.1 aminotransferase class I/II-fold pyridoxal phosphate-dependen